MTIKQKMVIFFNVLIYLNDDQTLNNQSILKLFKIFGEKCIKINKSFNKYVKRLLCSPNSNQELLDTLNMFNNDLFNNDILKFKDLFENIVDQTRTLLTDKVNKRRIGNKFSLEEQYTLYKILHYSLKGEQLLSRECKELIYKKILGDAAIHSKHQISCQIFSYKSKMHSTNKVTNNLNQVHIILIYSKIFIKYILSNYLFCQGKLQQFLSF